MLKGDETRERIKEAALNLFHSRGYGSTSISDIIETTGVKKGNLYFHYSSKENLAIEVLKEALSIYEAYISSRITGDSSVEKLESMINAITEFHISGSRISGCIFGNMALESGGNGSVISEFIKDVFTRWESNFERLITRGVSDGELLLNESPAVFVRMIIASIEGGVMLCKVYGKTDPLVDCTDFIKSAVSERTAGKSSNKIKKRGI